MLYPSSRLLFPLQYVSRHEPESIRFASLETKPNLPPLNPPPSKLLLFWLLRPSNITPVPYALVSYPAVCTLSCELQSRNEIPKEKEAKRNSQAAILRFLLEYHCLESLNSLILAHVQLNVVIHVRIY